MMRWFCLIARIRADGIFGNDTSWIYPQDELVALSRLGVADPDRVATQLALLLDGAIAVSLVRDDPAFVRVARDAAVTLIEAAGRKKKKRRRWYGRDQGASRDQGGA
jgi:hypothetical protein